MHCDLCIWMESFCRSNSSKKRLRVRADGLLQVRVKLLQFGRVDIDRGLVRFAGKILRSVPGDCEIEADADGQQEVAVLQREIGSPCGDRSRAADKGWIVAGNQIGRAPGGDGRNAQQLPGVVQTPFSACANRMPLPANSRGRSA